MNPTPPHFRTYMCVYPWRPFNSNHAQTARFNNYILRLCDGTINSNVRVLHCRYVCVCVCVWIYMWQSPPPPPLPDVLLGRGG